MSTKGTAIDCSTSGGHPRLASVTIIPTRNTKNTNSIIPVLCDILQVSLASHACRIFVGSSKLEGYSLTVQYLQQVALPSHRRAPITSIGKIGKILPVHPFRSQNERHGTYASWKDRDVKLERCVRYSVTGSCLSVCKSTLGKGLMKYTPTSSEYVSLRMILHKLCLTEHHRIAHTAFLRWLKA
eukprot:1615814-Pyramimonas_sp.AAC.2